MKTIPYQFTVAWSEADQAYEATVPALRYVVAYGDSPEEAIKEVSTAANAALKAMEMEGKPLPAVDTTMERVKTLQPLLNLSAVATAAGIKVQTLASKIARGTAFTSEESNRIGKVFIANGIQATNYVAISGATRTAMVTKVGGRISSVSEHRLAAAATSVITASMLTVPKKRKYGVSKKVFTKQGARKVVG